MSISRATLQAYFAIVRPLREHLTDVLVSHESAPKGTSYIGATETTSLNNEEPIDIVEDLLDTCLVAASVSPNGWPRFTPCAPMCTMRDVLDRALVTLFARAKKTGAKVYVKPDNLLALGYRPISENSTNWNLHRPVENVFVNTLHTALRAPPWEDLLQRIGLDAMLHLVLDTSLFVSLPNDCLCQLVGPPLMFRDIPAITGVAMKSQLPQDSVSMAGAGVLKRKFADDHDSNRPSKRLRLARESSTVKGAPEAKAAEVQPITDNSGTKLDLLFSEKHQTVGAESIRTPADIAFARARIYYARAQRIPETDTVLVGIPVAHVLHRLRPAFHRRRNKVGQAEEPDKKQEASDVRYLAKYIFPRQFGLRNVFCSATSSNGAWSYPDYGDRETEIQGKGSVKTPQRVKPALMLLDQTLHYHSKTSYKALLEHACPSKLARVQDQGTKEECTIDQSIILEMMSEESIHLSQYQSLARSSMDIDTTADHDKGFVTTQPPELTPPMLTEVDEDTGKQKKPRFAEFACSVGEVWRYVVLVSDKVFPDGWWGGQKNRDSIYEYVKRFILARRYDTISLHHVLQGLEISAIAWLGPASSTSATKKSVREAKGPNGDVNKRFHVPTSDMQKRQELLQEFIFWYIDGFVLPLLKTTFYITESGAFRNRVLFFRQDDWAALCAPLLARLTQPFVPGTSKPGIVTGPGQGGTFQKLDRGDAEELLRQRKLGYSFVRLLPKETGVRPIVNLRRKRVTQKGPYGKVEQSINQVLQAAFQILAYEKKSSQGLMGASILGANELYAKLKAFKSQLSGPNGAKKLPQLYFVKLDVQACFDTITQAKLIQILRDIISEDAYLIRRFGQIVPAVGKIRRTFVKRAAPDYDHRSFLAEAMDIAAALRHAIFVDQVMYPTTTREQALALLEEHITENVVKIGNEFYQQVIGIPQGSVISSLLCSFFYGNLEKTHFSDIMNDKGTMLVRLIDDYLLVTTDLEKAKSFWRIMDAGHTEYGCFISRDKTLVNFDCDARTRRVPARQHVFPWCGYYIDMRSLAVSSDYTRFHDKYLQDSLSVHYGRTPGAMFTQKMLLLAKHRSHVIFCDSQLNGVEGVYRNIYQNFIVAAAKMHRYVRAWEVVPHHIFLLKVMHEMFRFAHATMRSSALSAGKLNDTVEFTIRVEDVTWLGCHAFHETLSRKPTHYRQVVASLASEITLPSAKHRRRRFGTVVSDGRVLLNKLCF